MFGPDQPITVLTLHIPNMPRPVKTWSTSAVYTKKKWWILTIIMGAHQFVRPLTANPRHRLDH
jgi:hypothetical protein